MDQLVLAIDVHEERSIRFAVRFARTSVRPRLVEPGDERLALVGRDVDRHSEPGIVDVEEAVAPLELVRDRLDERILLEPLDDLAARLEHELEELLLVELRVVREQDVGVDVVVSLVELVEVHVPSRLGPARRWAARV